MLLSRKKKRGKREKRGGGGGIQRKKEEAFVSQPHKTAKWTASAKPDMGNLTGNTMLSHKGSRFRINLNAVLP